MPIYLLKRIGEVGWDENRAMVIRAKDEDAARELADKEASSREGKGIWKNKEEVIISKINKNGPEEIILIDVLEG